MNKTAQLTVALLAYLVAGVAFADGVYKWVDEQGITHFTDRPPMGAVVEAVDVDIDFTDRQQLSDDATRKKELDEAAGIREQHESEDQATREQEMAEVAANRQANCKQATERLQRYNTARKLYKPLANGERQYLSSDELDAERAAANATVREWCGS